MTADPPIRNRTFAGLRVDAIARDDGRYLLYYSWPDDPPPELERLDEQDVRESQQRSRARDQHAWTPEAGPPRDDRV